MPILLDVILPTALMIPRAFIDVGSLSMIGCGACSWLKVCGLIYSYPKLTHG